MSISRQRRGWLSPRFGLAGVAGAALLATTVAAPQASSAPDPNCPAAVPMTAVRNGMQVHGLTVSSGTTPDSFQGEVLGVLQDGIAPGLDMIMVRISGSEVTDANGNVDKGIWAGMSGSPVYDAQGRLLGAVAYGLSWSPSDVAGITPGVEMMKLLNGPSSTLRSALRTAKVAIPGRTADRLVSQGAMTTAQSASGFHRLPMPFSVSGLSQRHLAKVSNRANINRPIVTGNSTSAAAPKTPIVPGGNLAAALSYGDITYAGVGTATAVCDRNVLAFGHPMLWSGGSTLSMHGGNAIYIQKDSVFGSFKVANVTAPVGRLVGDHLAGIRGRVGRLPQFTDVTSHVTATNGNSRDGETKISYRPYTPYLSSLHLISNADRVLDQFGPGSARVKWTFNGTRADGSSWTYTRQDRFASRYDITFESIWDSYRQMSQILHNKFERVRITDVNYDASYSPKVSALLINKVQIKPGAKWITITNHRPARIVRAGTDLPVRLTLTSSNGKGDPIVVNLAVSIPLKARGNQAILNVQGGAGSRGPKAKSFDELLTKLANAPRNAAVTATFSGGGRKSGSTTSDSRNVTDVVSGDKHVHLIVK